VNYLDIIDTLAPQWHAKAACHPENGHWPDIWFPEARGSVSRPIRAADAVNICRQCPVRTECLRTAIENGETSGVWGGVDFEGKSKRRVA